MVLAISHNLIIYKWINRLQILQAKKALQTSYLNNRASNSKIASKNFFKLRRKIWWVPILPHKWMLINSLRKIKILIKQVLICQRGKSLAISYLINHITSLIPSMLDAYSSKSKHNSTTLVLLEYVGPWFSCTVS